MNKKTVLITGSTSGIGLAIARTFAREGYNIVFNGLEKNGDEISSAMSREFRINHLFSDANMKDTAALRDLVKQCVDTFGRIDVLVNNAGIQHVCPVEDFPEDIWNDIININLTAVFHLTKAAWPHMKKQHFGRIINIASVHALVASEFKSAYVSSKHAVIGFTKTIALEGAPFGITCNAICPGYVKTPLVEHQIPDLARAHNMPETELIEKVLLKKQAIKQFIPANAIGEMAVFLASGNAATITGTSMAVDGGWSAQ